jgi:site-specific DNA-cytosine methylase
LDTLETGDLPQRFFLSAKACAGILRRAEKRGKTLPSALQQALLNVVTQNQKQYETYIPMAQPIAWDEELNPSIDVAGTIVRGGQGGRHDGVAQPIAVDVYNQTIDGQVSATLTEACGGTNTSGPKVMQPVAYRPQNFGDKGGGYVEAEITNTLDAIQGSKQRHLAAQSMQVRRLTPVECERLQGFPDKYTAIPWRGKTETPDGPRYKALGNSMAVPVMKWIGEKIQRRAA